MIARMLAGGSVVGLLASMALAQEAASQPADADAKYTKMIADRADDNVSAAKGLDDAKAARAKEIVVAYYRDIRDMDATRDEQIKSMKKGSPEAKAVADAEQAKKVELVKSLAEKLNAEMSPEQAEAIKDKIVYNVRQVTYGAYLDEIPKLTDEQKKYIADELLEARELALTGGSSKEKHGWFDKYKGRINNYLSKQGYDMKAENAGWAERRKAAATQRHGG